MNASHCCRDSGAKLALAKGGTGYLMIASRNSALTPAGAGRLRVPISQTVASAAIEGSEAVIPRIPRIEPNQSDLQAMIFILMPLGTGGSMTKGKPYAMLAAAVMSVSENLKC